MTNDFLSRLSLEIARWEECGLITSEQGKSIIGSYGPFRSTVDGPRFRTKLISLMAILGVILIGLGLVSFIASGWDLIPKLVKINMLIVMMMVAYGLAYWTRYIKKYERIGTAILLLACILYGVSIHLVAQIYNFPLDNPWLFTWFLCGVAPLSFLVRSQAVNVLTIVIALAAPAFWLGEYVSFYSDPLDSGMVPIFSFMFYWSLGLGLYGLGRLQNLYAKTRFYATAFQISGCITLLASMYLLGFAELFEYLHNEKPEPFSLYSGLGAHTGLWIMLFMALGTGVLSLTGAAIRDRALSKGFISLYCETALSVLIGFVIIFVAFDKTGHSLVYGSMFNLMFVISAFGFILIGFLRRREVFVNVSLVFIGLYVVSKYFEYSWDLLDKSLVFVLAGIILVSGGILLERGRKVVLKHIEEQ